MSETSGLSTTVSLEFSPAVASTSANMTINNFVNLFNSNSLLLRPPFQRNLVWNADQQSFLVDSILRGLPVPEIYVQSTTTADGDETILVVDGQQRITTCLRFVLGELTLTDDDQFDSRWRKKAFVDLSPEMKQRFRAFELIVRKMPDVGEVGLREIFRRLNKTVEALEAQELRHAAYTGPLIHLIEQTASHATLNEIGVFSARDYLRRRSDEFVAEVMLAVYLKAFPNKKEGLDTFFKTFEEPDRVNSEFLISLERRIGRALEQLAIMSPPLRKTRFRNKSDFYTLFVYLIRRAEALPLSRERTEELTIRLRAFSDAVAETKRAQEAGSEPATDAGETAPAARDAAVGSYLRAVERAASDRLNRVRRDASLNVILSDVLESQHKRELSSRDAEWRTQPEPVDESDAESIEERILAQQALMDSPSEVIATTPQV